MASHAVKNDDDNDDHVDNGDANNGKSGLNRNQGKKTLISQKGSRLSCFYFWLPVTSKGIVKFTRTTLM